MREDGNEVNCHYLSLFRDIASPVWHVESIGIAKSDH